jgi:hypothetical protein
MSFKPYRADELQDCAEVPGPCLYSIHRKCLEMILRFSFLELSHFSTMNLAIGFYNSIHHPSKIVSGIRIKASAIHDWD